MQKKTKAIIIILSILSAAGVGYFVYSKIRINRLNKKISTLEEADDVIDNIDVNMDDIPENPSTEPELPLPEEDATTADYSTEDDIFVGEFDTPLIVYTKNGSRLRSEPNTNSTIKKTYQEGEVFFVIGSSNESDGIWYNVDDNSGNSGWFRSDVVTTY